MEPTPGYKSTEGAAALVGIGGPLLTAIISRDLTWQQLVALGIVAFVACFYIFARTWLKRAAAPTVAALALVLLASPASADPPAPVKPSLVLPVAPAVPAVAPDVSEAARVQAALAAFNAGLLSAQAGLTNTPILKPWSETKAGQVVLGCIAGAVVVTSAGATTAGMLATWPR